MTEFKLFSDTHLEREWLDLIAGASPPVRELLTSLAARRAERLASEFYQRLFQQEEAKSFITHEAVTSRLQASMQRWVVGLLSSWEPSAFREHLMRQRQIGIVHSRLNVPIELVLASARALKDAIVQSIMNTGPADDIRIEAITISAALVDIALEIMSAQYTIAHEKSAREDESYRSFISSSNVSLERERQRNALIDWERHFLREVMVGGSEPRIPRISESAFGLWLRHKAVVAFTDQAYLDEIMAAMSRIDDTHLPACKVDRMGHDDIAPLRSIIHAINIELERIGQHLELLFDKLVNLELGRDSLTLLLSRRFQRTILSREIEHCRASGKTFLALLIDIDGFRNANFEFGTDMGDRYLQHLAAILASHTRSSDFLFRHGGDEFLLLRVESGALEASDLAGKIRASVEQSPLHAPGGRMMRPTVGIGATLYDGHPDPNRVLERVETGLRKAKQRGPGEFFLEA